MAEELENEQDSGPLKPNTRMMAEGIITPTHTCHFLEVIPPTL